VVSDRGLANVMVSKKPFDAGDDQALRQVLDRYGFEFLYRARAGSEPALAPGRRPGFRLRAPPHPVRRLAATDDRPFFYYTVSARDFFRGTLPGRAGFDDRGPRSSGFRSSS